MKELGVVRRRLSGKEADPYIGQARKILGEMKNIMQMGGIKQLSWTKDLQNGVRIMVSSIFGQDEVRILVPVFANKPAEKAVIEINTSSIRYIVFYPILMRLELDIPSAIPSEAISDTTFSTNMIASARYADAFLYHRFGQPFFLYKDGKSTQINFSYQSSSLAQGGGVSGDAEFVVIGTETNLQIWSNGGIVIHNLGVDVNNVYGMSETGKYVLARTSIGLVRWSKEGGNQVIPCLASYYDYAVISADGSTVAGTDDSGYSFYWTEADGIKPIVNNTFAEGLLVNGISRDGKYIVGEAGATNSDGYATDYAFKWDAINGAQLLPITPVDAIWRNPDNRATDISDDGRIIVGNGISTAATSTGVDGFLIIWRDGGGYELVSNDVPVIHNIYSARYGWQVYLSMIEDKNKQQIEY